VNASTAQVVATAKNCAAIIEEKSKILLSDEVHHYHHRLSHVDI
jgi:hypothetical protein